jgi:hypothetical protein
MSEHRRQILEMLSVGKITADEAERLIAALEKDAPSGGAPVAANGPAPKYLRVMVEQEKDRDGDTLAKTVNIRVPLQLLRAGVRLASLVPPQARHSVDAALKEKGVPFDLSQLKPENIEELIAQLKDVSIDADDAKGRKVKVRVFCE